LHVEPFSSVSDLPNRYLLSHRCFPVTLPLLEGACSSAGKLPLDLLVSFKSEFDRMPLEHARVAPIFRPFAPVLRSTSQTSCIPTWAPSTALLYSRGTSGQPSHTHRSSWRLRLFFTISSDFSYFRDFMELKTGFAWLGSKPFGHARRTRSRAKPWRPRSKRCWPCYSHHHPKQGASHPTNTNVHLFDGEHSPETDTGGVDR